MKRDNRSLSVKKKIILSLARRSHKWFRLTCTPAIFGELFLLLDCVLTCEVDHCVCTDQGPEWQKKISIIIIVMCLANFTHGAPLPEDVQARPNSLAFPHHH